MAVGAKLIKVEWVWNFSPLTVAGDVTGDLLEETENLSGFVVAPRFVFGVDEVAVDSDVEYSVGSRGQRQALNNVLIVRE